jgi:hypothetical protein
MTGFASILLSTSVHDLFHSTAFHIVRAVVLTFLVLLWLGLAFWVHRDARRRIDDGLLVGIATLLGLVPLLGPLVYLLFRPPETLDEAHARRVEVAALQSRLFAAKPRCPVCRADVEPAFLVCPVCTTQLKEPCAGCSAPLEPSWQACPFCAMPVASGPRPDTYDLDRALTADIALREAPRRRKGRSRRLRRPAAP